MLVVGWIVFAAAMARTATLHGMQNSPKVAILEQEGWAAIKAGKLAEAIDAFGEAIRLDPKNAWLRLGAGTAEFLARHDAEAKAQLEQALRLDATLVRARAQLAQVVKRQGDLQEAIRLYEVVVSEVPNDTAARDTLDRWKRERDLHERMRLEVGDFFTISFEGAEDAALAATALESLNRAFWRICDVFGAQPPKSVPVVLYTGEQFQDITRSPKWAAAAFDGIIRVPMKGAGEKGEDLDRVLAHEFTHALLRSIATRGLPAWLNEGLASVLESDNLDWATARLAKVDKAPSLTALSGSFGRLSGAEAQVAYATSAIAARRLLDEAGGAAITNLLRDLAAGIDFETAFLHRIQRPFADFEASLPDS
ncbi:MAG TPA: tetratricopeptide repeat protein [Vicinamibacterales bacterium]|nr:tetratricopeptide repeat protein [Vicinamibacterales bacterium]